MSKEQIKKYLDNLYESDPTILNNKKILKELWDSKSETAYNKDKFLWFKDRWVDKQILQEIYWNHVLYYPKDGGHTYDLIE